MRIVQAIETSGPGGAEQVLVQLCRKLRDDGHDVTALLLKEGALKRTLDGQGFETVILPLSRPLDPPFGKALRSYLRDVRAEVLHSHEITFALYGRAASAWSGIAHVATAHGNNFHRGVKRKSAGAFFLRPTARFRLVSVSDALARQLAGGFLLRRESIEVVPNGVDIPVADVAVSRQEGEPLRLLAVGNLYPVKNHAFSIRMVAALKKKGVQVELDILGRGGEEPRLRELIDALGLADLVRLRGFCSDVDSFLSRAHVLVSSSISEGMPMSFLEAMGARLPIVTSRVGGVPELIEEGVQGLLFESGDLPAAVNAIERLAKDEPLRRRLGEGGATTVRDRHSARLMVDRYVNLYKRLMIP